MPPGYPKQQPNWHDCVQSGLSESYELLFQGPFSRYDLEENKLYPKYYCEKVIVPEPKPKIEKEVEKQPALSTGTIVRSIFRLVTYSIN